MERGSRLKSLLDSLEKLNSGTGKSGKSKEDELSQYRYTTAKILQYIESQDKINRDTIVKNTSNVTCLISTLQIINDRGIQQAILQIILELIGKTNSGKRAAIFVSNGLTVVVFTLLVALWKEAPGDDILIVAHQVLLKLGQKDRKFGVKARLCQALPVTAGLVRHYTGNNHYGKPLQTLLSVLRLLCHNQQNATFLGRNGAISLLFRIVSACGKRYLVVLKMTLDTLTQLVKSKSNSARAIGQNAVPVLIDLFTVWYRTDTKNRHVPLRKAILNVLRLLANLKSGRSALLEHDGLAKLYDFCELGRGVPELETMVLQASLILRKCFPRNRLPVPSYTSVLRCPLPESSLYPNSALSGSGDPTQPADLDLDAEDSPFDEDDDVSSGEEYMGASGSRVPGDVTSQETSPPAGGARSGSRSAGGNGGGSGCGSSDVYTERSLEDLIASYERFFPELLEFQPEDGPPSDPWSACVDESLAAAVAAGANGTSRHARRQESQRQSASQEDGLFDDDELNGCGPEPEDEEEEELEEEDDDDEEMEDNRSNASGAPSFLNLELTLPSAALPPAGGEAAGEPDLNMESSLRSLRLAPEAVQPRKHSSPELASVRPPGMSTGPSRNVRRSGRLKALLPPGSEAPVSSGQLPFLVSAMTATERASPSAEAAVTAADTESGELSFLTSKAAASRRRRKASTKVRRNSAAAAVPGIAATLLVPPRPSRNGAAPGRLQANSNNNHDAASPANAPEEGGEEMTDFTEAFVRLSAFTRSLGRFSRIGYPDLIGSQPTAEKEPFGERRLATQQAKVMDDMRRIVECDDLINKVVFDLDQIVARDRMYYNCAYSRIANEDETKVDQINYEIDHLLFDSQFESGNLRKAIQVRQYEYDLILNPDIGTNHHVQWFYFRVSNIEAGVPYRFNIINCEKPNSQFNFGMRPVVFSVREALYKRGCWRRMGEQICYYKNHFARSASTNGGVEGRSYYTTSFCISFPHEGDICYVAYHYPYTYSQLRADLELLDKRLASQAAAPPSPGVSGEESAAPMFVRMQNLCHTILGNEVPLLTITAAPRDRSAATIEQLRSRPYVFLTARVHPGESNSSWVMRGTMNYLLSQTNTAKQLREQFIFKVVPMLNPDGVINGNHRCSMSAEDLNRKWLNPCPSLHPTIYHTKGMIAYLHRTNRPPLVFCDYHGHSRKKNVFMYGCSPTQSWINEDTDNPAWIAETRLEDTGYKVLPRLLQSSAPAFSLPNCSYVVDKAKETTARVVVWRQFRVLRSYTMESTYCGCDQGIYRGLHVSTRELEEMGWKFCESLIRIRSRHANAAMAAAGAAGPAGRASLDQLGATGSQGGSGLTVQRGEDSFSGTDSKNAEGGMSSASGLDDVNEEFDTAYEDDSDDTADSGDEDWFDQSDAEEQEEDG